MLPQIAAGRDHDISSRLQQALKKSGIDFKTSCAVHGHRGQHRALRQSGAPGALSAECILNATGRAPVVDGLGLAEVGVDFDRKGIKTSDQGKTNVPGIWACGDVTGRRLLAHAATREGIVAVNNMFGKPDRIRYDAIPSVIYTHPEVASVGKTEEELKAQGIEYKKALAAHGRRRPLPGGERRRHRHGESAGRARATARSSACTPSAISPANSSSPPPR